MILSFGVDFDFFHFGFVAFFSNCFNRFSLVHLSTGMTFKNINKTRVVKQLEKRLYYAIN